MNKFKFELDTKGVGELLKSEEMMRVLEVHAQSIASQAGEDYTSKVMPTRAIAIVKPKNEAGERDNLENNTLLKAVY